MTPLDFAQIRALGIRALPQELPRAPILKAEPRRNLSAAHVLIFAKAIFTTGKKMRFFILEVE